MAIGDEIVKAGAILNDLLSLNFEPGLFEEGDEKTYDLFITLMGDRVDPYHFF